jgi:hypothetical protein
MRVSGLIRVVISMLQIQQPPEFDSYFLKALIRNTFF